MYTHNKVGVPCDREVLIRWACTIRQRIAWLGLIRFLIAKLYSEPPIIRTTLLEPSVTDVIRSQEHVEDGNMGGH